ncbi:hypothetical protein [Musicola keenii]|uniref:hypothetical protein n=1 Tax=Musicola keenii TaxID=2884250 RepID=UPI0017872BFB|nr:hypothetical protein [Musicola keenii]
MTMNRYFIPDVVGNASGIWINGFWFLFSGESAYRLIRMMSGDVVRHGWNMIRRHYALFRGAIAVVLRNIRQGVLSAVNLP